MRLKFLPLALALVCLGCQTDDGPYPSRDIKLIVQASPGGTSDTVSRFMATLAEEELGVPVVPFGGGTRVADARWQRQPRRHE